MIAVPELDTVAFDALVEEGRGLIPRFAPAWTDHNLHDPGMTLLDLIAWFVDQQVYRIGFVSDDHIAAFAALLGVELQGAKPAAGLIWPGSDTIIPNGTVEKGSSAHPKGRPDLPFVTTRKLRLHATSISQVTAHVGDTVRSVKLGGGGEVVLDDKTDAIEIAFKPPLKDGGPAALGLAYPGPLPDLRKRPPVRVSSRGAVGNWQPRKASWCMAPDRTNGVLLISVPQRADPIHAIRLELGADLPRRLLPVRVALNVIPVSQVEIVEGLKIGEGTGWPDHELLLALEQDTVPTGKIRLTSGPNKSPLKWRCVRDFSKSKPNHNHFLFDPGRRSIRFGNGINGRAMPAGHEVSCARLRVTRGSQGNVAAGASWTVSAADRGSKAGFGTNRSPISGGADAWSRGDLLTELHRRARKRIAMLTDADMVGAATKLEGYGVERAEVLSRFVPSLPRHPVPGARTLLLRPSRTVDATDDWVDAIERALSQRRVLGERLTVAAVEEASIEVSAELLVAAGTDREQIEKEAKQHLQDRLSIARRRDDQDIPPWPAGRPVTIAELETLLAAVDGVIAVTDLKLARTGDALARVSLPLSPLEVATLAEPDIRFRVEG